jgi:hypothetical protein
MITCTANSRLGARAYQPAPANVVCHLSQRPPNALLPARRIRLTVVRSSALDSSINGSQSPRQVVPASNADDSCKRCTGSEGFLLVQCPDAKGVVASLAQLLFGFNCNILQSDQFTDETFATPRCALSSAGVCCLACWSGDSAPLLLSPFDLSLFCAAQFLSAHPL